MKTPADNPRLMTVRVDTPAALERVLRAFATEVVIAPRADDARERRFAEASARHQQLLAQRLAAA